jgi:hypothetical protein
VRLLVGVASVATFPIIPVKAATWATKVASCASVAIVDGTVNSRSVVRISAVKSSVNVVEGPAAVSVVSSTASVVPDVKLLSANSSDSGRRYDTSNSSSGNAS